MLVLLALVTTARILASRVVLEGVEETFLHAPAILRELESPAHRMLQGDPEYRQYLFERYAPMLREDMVQLLKLRFSVRRYFWYGCFRAYYGILSMKRVPEALGLERDGLRILVAFLSPALKGFSTQELRA